MKITTWAAIVLLSWPLRAGAQNYSFSGPDSASGTDSASAASQNPLQLVEIQTASHFSVPKPRVGDTLSYLITVEWANPQVPVMVMAPESLSFAGLRLASTSTDHQKLVEMQNGQPRVKNRSEFLYHLVAITSGPGKALPARLAYYSALGPEREYLHLSAAYLDILPARAPLLARWWMRSLLALLALAGAWFGLKYWRARRAAHVPEPAAPPALREEAKALASRVSVAAPKAFLLEAEALCRRWLEDQFPARRGARTGDLISAQLSAHPGENEEGWQRLRADFELANFGGGDKPPHELAETMRTLKTCLHLQEEQP